MSRPSSASAVVRIRSFVSVVATFFLLFLILAAAGGGGGSVNAQEEEQTENSDTTTDTTNVTSNNNVSYTNIRGWEASSEVIEWEKSNLIAWSKTPDCLPSTGMCNSCGLGAIVVEFKQIINNSTDINSINNSINYTTGGAVYDSFSSEFINDNIYLEDSIIDDKKLPELIVDNLPDFINKDGIQYTISYRSYSIGLGGNPSPWDYNKQSFEIASYTKAITGLTMQVQIEEGSVSEDFLIKDFLPECDWESSVSALSGDDGGDVGSITFEELRLHLSGLPPQPPNRAETGSPGGNPFGNYDTKFMG